MLRSASIFAVKVPRLLLGIVPCVRMWLLRKIFAILTRFWLRWFGPRWTVGCLALLRDTQGRICLLKHRGRIRPWGLPGGLVAWPEAPEQGLRRELVEELSWESALSASSTLPLTLKGSCTSEKIPMLEMIYEAQMRISSDVSASWVIQTSEIMAVGWFTRDEIEKMDGLLERHRLFLLNFLDNSCEL